MVGMFSLTAIMLCWLFPPAGFWPLAFVALVPWGLATCQTHRAWLVHWMSLLVGWCFFLVAVRWLMPVTGLGYTALAAYLAIYWTLAGWVLRTGLRHGVSPLWTLPIAWVACEFLRGTVMSGFPWLFLAHGCYSVLPLIQISDITGAYGVSFLAALVSGVLVEAGLQRWPVHGRRPFRRQFIVGTVCTAGLLGATLAYGYYRLGEIDHANRPDLRGPRIAVIQEDFPLVSHPPYGAPPQVVLSHYLALAALAAREKPDLVVFPETVWSAVQNLEFVEQPQAVIDDEDVGMWRWGLEAHNALTAFVQGKYGEVNKSISMLERADRRYKLPRLPDEGGPPVTAIVGSVSIETFPEATYPKLRKYNSALVYDPDTGQRKQRYDKIHLVPFGEFVPFRQQKFMGIDLHYWLYQPLNRLSPFSRHGTYEYSLTHGAKCTIFELDTPQGHFRFGTPICYEDTVPYLARRYVWGDGTRRVDFLVNISNDAWFLYSNELPQHLAICTFRAVENRVSIARAVNTGISGFIDPNGRIYSRVQDDQGRSVIYRRFGKDGDGIVGYDLQPVYLDPRGSLYGRWGDWLAWTCTGLAAVLWAGAVFERWILAVRNRLRALFAKGAAA